MRLLLINPPTTLEERYGKLSGIGTLYPPLGLAYLAAYSEKKGQSEKAMKMTQELGIETWASFMMGLPSETKEESEQTINFAIKTNPTFAQFPITTPYPGTKLYDIALKHGKLKTSWENFTNWDEVVFVSNGRTEEEIKNIVKKAYRRFYLRPDYILKRTISVAKLPLNKSIALIKTGILTIFK